MDHLLPVYLALPDSVRGQFITGKYHPEPESLTVVSSYGDYKLTAGPVIYIDHGVGFSFSNDHSSYAGGKGRERVIAFLSTNEYADCRNRETYPDAYHKIVGCPKMDGWANLGSTGNEIPVVAFSFHWDCRVVPETRSAFSEYRPELTRIARMPQEQRGWSMLGHGHPRLWNSISRFWESVNVDLAPDFTEVMQRADLYVADATSTLYEFAATGKPVVVINSKLYRKHVHHGLRFWEHVPGEQVDSENQLVPMIRRALTKDTFKNVREEAVKAAYPHLGVSTEKTVKEIVKIAKKFSAP